MMVRDGRPAPAVGAAYRPPSSASAGASVATRPVARRARVRRRTPPAALDLLDLLELAWHDTHGDLTPPADVVEDVWRVADGDLGRLVAAARLAITDWRDLRVAADQARALVP